MTIIQAPNPILEQAAVSVDKVTPELQDTARQMVSLMKEHHGAGLAAPQVGLSIRLIVMDVDGHSLIMFNPLIMQASGTKELGDEGCLSFNYGKDLKKVKRHPQVKIKYRDLNGKMRYQEFQGFAARVVLHEMDHLNGINFTEREEK